MQQSEFEKLTKYFDESYLVGDKYQNFIGILTQELRNEPYMNIDLDEVDLITYQATGSLKDILDFMEQQYKRPQITRVQEDNLDIFFHRGWQHILNKDNSMAILRKIRRNILPDEVFEISPNIRKTEESDLIIIEELFRREYPLRYRMVQYLYDQDIMGNFVYVDDKEIVGVTFNERRKDYLYCRQIFVKKSKRNKSIGSKLNQFRLNFARENGLYVIFANIRGDAINFHLKQGVELTTEKEYYLINK